MADKRDDVIAALYAARHKARSVQEKQFLLILAMMLEMGKLRGYTLRDLREEAAKMQEKSPKRASLIDEALWHIDRGHMSMPFQPQVEDPGFVAWVATLRRNDFKISRLDRALSHPSESPSKKYPASLCALFKSEEDAQAALESLPDADRNKGVVVPTIVTYAERTGGDDE